MTATTTTETETVYQLPVEAVTPDPGNRKAEPDAQFVASVRTHGVMQPLTSILGPSICRSASWR